MPAIPPIRPASFEVEETDDVFRITRRWFRLPTVLLFCALTPSFLWLGATRSTVVPTLLGLVFAYGLLLFLVNRTVIEVTEARLTISHGPLPSLLTNVAVERHRLARLLLAEEASLAGLGGADIDYELTARLTNGESIVLLSDLPDLEQASALATRLGERLGIEAGTDPNEARD